MQKQCDSSYFYPYEEIYCSDLEKLLASHTWKKLLEKTVADFFKQTLPNVTIPGTFYISLAGKRKTPPAA